MQSESFKDPGHWAVDSSILWCFPPKSSRVVCLTRMSWLMAGNSAESSCCGGRGDSYHSQEVALDLPDTSSLRGLMSGRADAAQKKRPLLSGHRAELVSASHRKHALICEAALWALSSHLHWDVCPGRTRPETTKDMKPSSSSPLNPKWESCNWRVRNEQITHFFIPFTFARRWKMRVSWSTFSSDGSSISRGRY